MKVKKIISLIYQLLKEHLLPFPQWPTLSFPSPKKESAIPKVNIFLSSIPQKMQHLQSKPPPSLYPSSLTMPGPFLWISLWLPLSVSSSKSSLCLLTPAGTVHIQVLLPWGAWQLSCPQPASGILSSALRGIRQAYGLSDGDRDREAQGVQKRPL